MNFEAPYHRPNIEREIRLKRYFEVVSEHFGKGDGPHPAPDKEILTSIEKNKGEISGRTALITEVVLADYVKSLTSRNREIERMLSMDQNANRANLEEEIAKNNEKIAVITQNCLKTLGAINDNVL